MDSEAVGPFDAGANVRPPTTGRVGPLDGAKDGCVADRVLEDDPVFAASPAMAPGTTK